MVLNEENLFDWDHHWDDEISIRTSQNPRIARIQFMGDKWGILESLFKLLKLDKFLLCIY